MSEPVGDGHKTPDAAEKEKLADRHRNVSGRSAGSGYGSTGLDRRSSLRNSMRQRGSSAILKRTSSTATTNEQFDRQKGSVRSLQSVKSSSSVRTRLASISRSEYHEDLKPILAAKLNLNLIFATFIIVFGSSFQFGYNIGVLNQPAKLIKDFYNSTYTSRYGNFTVSTLTLTWSLTTAIFIPGGMIGAFLGGWLADNIGRKKTILLSHIFAFLGATSSCLCVIASSPELLMLGRILVGINSGLGNCIAPMFLSEIAPFNYRGAFGTLHQLLVTLGILVASVMGIPEILGTPERWPFLIFLEVGPALVSLLILPFLPETPRFLLLVQRNRTAAQKALQFYRRTDDVSNDMEEMDTEDQQKASVKDKTKEKDKAGVAEASGATGKGAADESDGPLGKICAGTGKVGTREKDGGAVGDGAGVARANGSAADSVGNAAVAESGTAETAEQPKAAFTLRELFMSADLLRPLAIACMLQITQQFSGINAVFFYSQGIFENARVPPEHIPYAIIGTNAVNVLMTVIAVPMMDIAGRRLLLLIPMAAMIVDLTVMSTCFILQAHGYAWNGIEYVSVACVIIYVIAFAVGLGPIPMMIGAELFRQAPRPLAMAIAGVVNWIGTFAIAMGFESIQQAAQEYTFLIFVVLLIFFLVFTWLFVPETKNKTFEEIAAQFSPGGHLEVEEIVGEDEEDVFDEQAPPAEANDDDGEHDLVTLNFGGGGGGGEGATAAETKAEAAAAESEVLIKNEAKDGVPLQDLTKNV